MLYMDTATPYIVQPQNRGCDWLLFITQIHRRRWRGPGATAPSLLKLNQSSRSCDPEPNPYTYVISKCRLIISTPYGVCGRRSLIINSELGIEILPRGAGANAGCKTPDSGARTKNNHVRARTGF